MALNVDVKKTGHDINNAIDLFRRSGRKDHLIRSLLVSAQFYQLSETQDMSHARDDIDEAMNLCERGGIKFHEADCHLEYARWHVTTFKLSNVQTDILEARKHLATAKEMIAKMGYHRRDKEVVELEKTLENG